MNLNSLPEMSASAEGLFSQAKFILTHNWCKIQPYFVEVLMMLKVNSVYWDLPMVFEAINTPGVPGKQEDKELQQELEGFVADMMADLDEQEE